MMTQIKAITAQSIAQCEILKTICSRSAQEKPEALHSSTVFHTLPMNNLAGTSPRDLTPEAAIYILMPPNYITGIDAPRLTLVYTSSVASIDLIIAILILPSLPILQIW